MLNTFLKFLKSTILTFILSSLSFHAAFGISVFGKDEQLAVRGLLEGTVSRMIANNMDIIISAANLKASSVPASTSATSMYIPLTDADSNSTIKSAAFLIFGNQNSVIDSITLSDSKLSQSETSAMFIKFQDSQLGDSPITLPVLLKNNSIVIIFEHRPINNTNIRESLTFPPERSKCFTDSEAISRAAFAGDSSILTSDGSIASSLIQNSDVEKISPYLQNCKYATIVTPDLGLFTTNTMPEFSDTMPNGINSIVYSITPEKIAN